MWFTANTFMIYRSFSNIGNHTSLYNEWQLCFVTSSYKGYGKRSSLHLFVVSNYDQGSPCHLAVSFQCFLCWCPSLLRWPKEWLEPPLPSLQLMRALVHPVAMVIDAARSHFPDLAFLAKAALPVMLLVSTAQTLDGLGRKNFLGFMTFLTQWKNLLH